MLPMYPVSAQTVCEVRNLKSLEFYPVGFERGEAGTRVGSWCFGAELQAQKSRRSRSANSITLCEADYMQNQPHTNSTANLAPRFPQSESVARISSHSVPLAA